MKLVGKRIFLRPWKKTDVPRLVELCADKTISKFTTVPWPYKKKDAEKFVKRSVKIFKKKEGLNFAIVLKAQNLVIGSASLLRFDKKSRHAELGYWLGKEFRGKGIVPETAVLLLNFGFKKLKLHRIEGQCAVENNSSKRVFEKLGFEFECIRKERGFLGGKFTDVFSFAMLDREFNKKNKKQL